MLIIIIFVSFMSINNTVIIPNNSIRFRIIANSNSEIDQNTKINIKKDLESTLFPKLQNSNSKEETKKIIEENENLIEETINKYNIPYSINYGNNYFPVKEYKGINYPEGEYESLVISLGEAKGNNWWCIMYPPLCLIESKEDQIEENEYKFFIKEIINKIA